MRLALAAVLMVLGVGSPAEKPASPVLVELFTSEGCSSCPPADRLLSRLQADGRIVALAFHVDYWDSLGWKDPFGSAAFTGRQRDHAARLPRGGLYTPQMVVDGGSAFVGSDEEAARRALEESARRPKPALRLDLSGEVLSVSSGPPAEPAVAWLALTEDGLQSRVLRGENGGRTLRHDGVVRELRRLGAAPPGAAFRLSAPFELKAGWNRAQMKGVVFLEARDGRILAVVSTRL